MWLARRSVLLHVGFEVPRGNGPLVLSVSHGRGRGWLLLAPTHGRFASVLLHQLLFLHCTLREMPLQVSSIIPHRTFLNASPAVQMEIQQYSPLVLLSVVSIQGRGLREDRQCAWCPVQGTLKDG